MKAKAGFNSVFTVRFLESFQFGKLKWETMDTFNRNVHAQTGTAALFPLTHNDVHSTVCCLLVD